MSRIVCFAVGLTVALATWAGSAAAQQWQEYKPAGAGYRVEMPGKPAVTEREQQTPAGTVKFSFARLAQGQRGLLASHAVYQAGALPADPEQALDNARDGATKGGKLSSEKRLKVDGAPARRIVLENSGQVVNLLVVMKGNTLYQLLYHQPQGGEPTPDMERFLSSFALVKG
ncbi:hypothetical protein FHP25_17935 [Vineibacter terrae]|uniref:DUF1795 domain-containing protein n=1 Tax=Vineibacter terrae TaxID=2586908 RepID=A0A5C8PJS1_9HYPH|nr:hypothetical protein [Vineibacter terrae]TXL74086.1 hypothetical protein FHP25_17935 [Vineibacter terrae]